MASDVSLKAMVLAALSDRGRIDPGRKLGVIHASELAFCGRAIYYCLCEEKPRPRVPPDLGIIFDAGHAMHGMVEAAVEDAEDEAYHKMLYEYFKFIGGDSVHCENEVYYHDLLLYGHQDLHIVRHLEPDVGGEIKTISKAGFTRLGKAKMDHVWQVHCYMKCTGLKRFVILYYCKDNGDMLEFDVEWDDKIWEKVEVKIRQLLDAFENREPPGPPLAKPGRECGKCRYQHLCELSGDYAWQTTASSTN